ncbi:MAG: sugar phosphate nucleotidyltransferase, partial [Candidatus Bipolaricaulota bacterium]
MRAVILCAGEGTRMRPLTYSKAKHLIPIANKPVIDLILKAVKDAGIREIGIVVSPGARAGFTSYLQDGSRNDLALSYIVQQKPKGLAHAVQCAQGFVGSEPFLLYLGDNLLENGVRGLVEQFQQGDSHAAISLVEVDNPRSFGVAWLEEDEIKRVVEKP